MDGATPSAAALGSVQDGSRDRHDVGASTRDGELQAALEREYERHESEVGQLRVDLQQARRSWDYWQARALRFESLLERHAPDALKAAQEEAGPDCPF